MSSSANIYQQVIITSIKQETAGVKTFTLSNANGGNIPYVAGQFITLVFQHHNKEERRSYSISSSPVLGEPLSFTVKRLDNGAYSRLLHDKAEVGDRLFITGVAGLFTLPQDINLAAQYFFFAAGIGITPIISLIKTLLIQTQDIEVVLVYSNRSANDVVFYNELNALAASSNGKFRIEYLYSTAFDLSRARLNKALVRQLLNEYGKVERNKMYCYVCGPFDYMRMVIYALEEGGVKDERIRKENFNVNERPAIMVEPPDKDQHKVTIIHNNSSQTINCQYPDTILKAARKNGIALPYSCETGRCGSCAARCTEGIVWHSYNEVLMDMDLRHGSILTCTGYPIGGDITIEV